LNEVMTSSQDSCGLTRLVLSVTPATFPDITSPQEVRRRHHSHGSRRRYGGTSEIMKTIIAREITGLRT
jgi:hypothetical protein